MKDKKNNKDVDERSDSYLPEVSLILIREPGKGGENIRIVNLDDFSSDRHKQYYVDAVEKYGSHNVRYCKVLGTKVTVNVEFVE